MPYSEISSLSHQNSLDYSPHMKAINRYQCFMQWKMNTDFFVKKRYTLQKSMKQDSGEASGQGKGTECTFRGQGRARNDA